MASEQGGLRRFDPKPPELRRYQHEAIAAIRSALLTHRSTLVVAATGTGKTVTFADVARSEISHGGRTLILVHRDELIRQAAKKCEAVGLYPDIEKGKQRANTLTKIVIASVQTMRGERLQRWIRTHFTKIIVDEAHHATSSTYRAVLDWFDGAKVIGFTATPDRADGTGLGEVFASVAYRYEIQQAIAEGYLVSITARRVVVDSVDLSGVGTRAGDFAQDQLATIMADEQALRGVVVPLLELASDRLTIGFCVDVAHAHAMAAMLNRYRPGCARAVSGKTDDDVREQLLADHAAGRFQFLMNCEVLVEGYDCPEVACVAMIRPTKSRARFVQCAGRGLRPAPGKADCLILNFTGTYKHRLIGPVDCLVGSDNMPDDVRDEIDRRLSVAQLGLDAVFAHALSEVEKRRASLKLSAVVRYHAEHIDPFIGEEDRDVLPPCSPAWENELASPRQTEALDRLGVTLSKLPVGFSRADAWRLLARINPRVDGGLCSYKAARKLAQAGVPNTESLGHERAKELLDKLRIGGWRPSAIAKEPEVTGGAPGSYPLQRGIG